MSELENTQTVVLQQNDGKKILLDLQHSTDWVVACSIVMSGIIALIGFFITVYIVRKSTESQISSNINLIQQQEDLKIKELKILNKNNNLNKSRELIANNLFLAGNLQNQIEIGIEEIRIGSPDKFYHSRNFGEFKAVLNSYQSSINQLTVYLGNDSSYSDDLKKYFRKMQLLSWNFYTADINENALRSSLDYWCGEYKIGLDLIEAYLKYEFDKIHK